MEAKYIIANIQIPLMINSDGTFTIMLDNQTIDFSNYEGNTLPVPNNNNLNLQLDDMITKIVMNKTQTSINSDSHVNKNNLSFKNYKNNKTSRFTNKSRHSL